jgi:hypothetical protein
MVVQASLSKRAQQLYPQILDASVWLTLATLVLYTASKHEPWADEADTWVEVRDLSWFRLVFSELRYDGHLPLWHSIVWIPMHLFHMSYDYFVFIGGVCAVAGLAVLVFLAPFPRILRYVIASSFFFIYQYAVVARPYVLMPLLGFLAAYFYRQGLPRIIPFAIAIALLIQDSSYAAVIGIALSAFYSLQLVLKWKEVPRGDRGRVFFSGSLIAASLVFAFIVLYPKSDSSLISEAAHYSLSQRLSRFAEGLTGAFGENTPAALPILLLAALWSLIRRNWLLLVLTVGGSAFEYGFLRGFGHHQGLITIAFVVFLWAVWPRAEERSQMAYFPKVVHQAFLAVLLITFGWQCSWSYQAIRGDWAGPYSGARDAAEYLKSVHAEKFGIGGYTFWAVGIQPYFSHNIFLNYGAPNSPALYHFSTDFEKRAGVLMQSEMENGPAFIVFAPEMNPREAAPIIEEFRALNYVLVHYSDGTRFFKGLPGAHAPYFIFERTEFLSSTRNTTVIPNAAYPQQSRVQYVSHARTQDPDSHPPRADHH